MDYSETFFTLQNRLCSNLRNDCLRGPYTEVCSECSLKGDANCHIPFVNIELKKPPTVTLTYPTLPLLSP